MKSFMTIIALVLSMTFSANAEKNSSATDLLVKFKPGAKQMGLFSTLQSNGAKVEDLINTDWVRVQMPEISTLSVSRSLRSLASSSLVEYVQPNYKIRLLNNYKSDDAKLRTYAYIGIKGKKAKPLPDNPEIPDVPSNPGSGADPLYNNQWGMKDNQVREAWSHARQSSEIVVAVIDTGVDYTHEDLLPNMWRNPNEIPANGIDDDHNGFVDDVIGWDFASNDNKPYDLSVDPMQMIISGGNPGHGTHCAGNVAARADNGIGISGVAPKAKIMALRFLTEKGEGTTAGAIQAIKYAVDNGAKVLSNSWGSEGEDPNEGTENQALRDVIKYAQDHGVLFVAAAGNGHNGVGYDNDHDSAPGYPASYTNDNIISVAAIDENNELGSFSNWGATSVDIGAPGVKVYSTMVGNRYSDLVLDMFGQKVYWDGTSMATPHVAGAAALYWSAHPEQSWSDVKRAILSSATPIPALQGKVVSNGKLNVLGLMQQ